MSEARMTEVFSVRMEPELKEALADMSEITARSMNYLISLSVRQYLREFYLWNEQHKHSLAYVRGTTMGVEKIIDKWAAFFKSR